MTKWLLVSHCLVVSALAASEAQLKFVPLPVERRRELKGTVEPLRSSPSASFHLGTVVPIANSSIQVNPREIPRTSLQRSISRVFHSHDPGRLHTAASYHQPYQGGDRANPGFGSDSSQSGIYHRDDHSRNYRGLASARVDGDLQGSHHERPVYRHQAQGSNNYRENRVEVRFEDFRKHQSSPKFQAVQNRPHEFYGGHRSQRPLESGDRLGAVMREMQNRDHREQNVFHRDRDVHGERRENSRRRPDEGQSCGAQSPCLEPNGLFAVSGNCCGFVNCANCRPYTQRCAAGTVFDLDLWICNHERDTRQCAGNNRDCAYQSFDLWRPSQDYENQDDGPSVGGHGGGGAGHNSNGWEYASASEVREVKRKTGKVSRVKKVLVKARKP